MHALLLALTLGITSFAWAENNLGFMHCDGVLLKAQVSLVSTQPTKARITDLLKDMKLRTDTYTTLFNESPELVDTILAGVAAIKEPEFHRSLYRDLTLFDSDFKKHHLGPLQTWTAGAFLPSASKQPVPENTLGEAAKLTPASKSHLDDQLADIRFTNDPVHFYARRLKAILAYHKELNPDQKFALAQNLTYRYNETHPKKFLEDIAHSKDLNTAAGLTGDRFLCSFACKHVLIFTSDGNTYEARRSDLINKNPLLWREHKPALQPLVP